MRHLFDRSIRRGVRSIPSPSLSRRERDRNRVRRSGRLAAALAASILFVAARSDARPHLCLPPVYEGGQRLHEMPDARIFWLELAMRQHEICWRQPARPEARIALLGSSAVYGFPLPVEKTFGALVNQSFAARGVPAHLFNLAWVNPYQLRDAVIFHEALRYEPDVVVYAITAQEFNHTAPVVWPSLLRFFGNNSDVLAEMVAAPPPGLEGPLDAYGRWLNRNPKVRGRWPELREVGRYVRNSSRLYARDAARLLHPSLPPTPDKPRQHQTNYDCAKTRERVAQQLDRFPDWNILAYLEEERARHGFEVVIVYWPIAHEPLGECYNVRFTQAIVDRFAEWVRTESERRGFHYLDLHDALPPERFVDSLHVSAEGHAQVAERVAAELDPLVERAVARRVGAGE
jgi:hypothetical protein